jgi:hypothetical protein
VSERQLSDDALRVAFQSLAAPPADVCTPEDLDRIARALDGGLPAAERRQLVERLSVEPTLAAEWRAASRLRRHRRTSRVTVEWPWQSPWRPATWAAVAAVVLLATAVVLVPRYRSNEGTLRNAGAYVIESQLADEAVLPRDGFRLRWNEGPQDSRYQVRVTTEDLQLLAAVADLGEPELVVDAAVLANVAAGSRIFWQVEGLLPGGERILSPTFVVRVQSGS